MDEEGIDQQYEDLKDAEEDLYNELMIDSVIGFGLIAITGWFVSALNNVYIIYLLVGIISWVVFFYTMSIAIAAGTIRAKRCEVGNQSEEVIPKKI